MQAPAHSMCTLTSHIGGSSVIFFLSINNTVSGFNAL